MFHDQAVLLREVEIEPNVVECVSKFCYLGDTLDSGSGTEGGSYS